MKTSARIIEELCIKIIHNRKLLSFILLKLLYIFDKFSYTIQIIVICYENKKNTLLQVTEQYILQNKIFSIHQKQYYAYSQAIERKVYASICNVFKDNCFIYCNC